MLFFRGQPSEVGKGVRMRLIAKKTCDGKAKGKTAFYCRVLGVSRQGAYAHVTKSQKPRKYKEIAEAMKKICAEDKCNASYGRTRMRMALKQYLPAGTRIPSEGTIQKIMVSIGIGHAKRRKPNGITKAERNARKSDNRIQRDFYADKPCTKCITDITEIKAKNIKLYVSGIFDCYDASVLGLAMDTHRKASLCVRTLQNARLRYPELKDDIIHSDRGAQYTSNEYRQAICLCEIKQSMNGDGGR